MIFNFDAVRLNRNGDAWRDWTLPELKAIYTQQDQALDVHSWNTVFLSNHDNPRVVSAFGNDSPLYRVASAKALATMLLTLKGTPFIYQGDELGMTNYPFTSIEQCDDIAVKNAWKALVLTNQVPADAFMANVRKVSRDNARTPMQWDNSANAGFTTAAKAMARRESELPGDQCQAGTERQRLDLSLFPRKWPMCGAVRWRSSTAITRISILRIPRSSRTRE